MNNDDIFSRHFKDILDFKEYRFPAVSDDLQGELFHIVTGVAGANFVECEFRDLMRENVEQFNDYRTFRKNRVLLSRFSG